MNSHPQLQVQNQVRAVQLAAEKLEPYVPFTQGEVLSWTEGFMVQLPLIDIKDAKKHGWTLLTDVHGPAQEIRESVHHALLIAGGDHKDLGISRGDKDGILVWIRPSSESPAKGAA